MAAALIASAVYASDIKVIPYPEKKFHRLAMGDTMGTNSPLDDVLIMADPYDTCDHRQDGYTVNNGEKFFSMWFDHSMLPKDQQNQPWIIARPKK